MAKTWAWIGGWGIPPARFRLAASEALPDYEHRVYEPNPTAVAAVVDSDPHRIGGYSLGSLLLLASPEKIPWDKDITCLAPITGFCREMNRGGTTPKSIIEQIHQHLEVTPEKAVRMFYRIAGLRDRPDQALPYAIEDLKWGLEELTLLEAASTMLPRVAGVIGRNDPLLNSDELGRQFPKRTLAYCGHDYYDLLQALR